MVGNRDEPHLAPSDDRVQTPQRIRVGGRLERFFHLLPGCIGGIESGAEGFLTHAGQEGDVAVEPIPRSVIDLNELPQRRIVDALQQRIGITPSLLPKDLVHGLGGLYQERDHLTLGLR